jgi:hypothetical protein
MIVFPKNWYQDYKKVADPNYVYDITETLKDILSSIGVNHLAYSGGIDSTVILAILSSIYDKVYTYTISSRPDHPDVVHAKIGASFFNSTHTEFIVKPTQHDNDKFMGDNAVRQLFENVENYTDSIICCDGIDEFMCGYYDHMSGGLPTYYDYIDKLLPLHFVPLNISSKNVKVYIPYLDKSLIMLYKYIPIESKVDKYCRKKIMVKIAESLLVPTEIINRNKYGFCDAFREVNK